MKPDDLAQCKCGVAKTLAVIGDRWTLLILRDAFHGVRRFDVFQERLAISTSVLAGRLGRLVREDVLARSPSPDDRRAVEYRLTQKGLDLYPVLVALNQWGETWMPDSAGPHLVLLERTTGMPITGAVVMAQSGRRLTARDVAPTAGPALEPEMAELVETHRKRLMGQAAP